MKISNMLQKSNIIITDTIADKSNLFEFLANKMIENNFIGKKDGSKFLAELEEREAMSTTGVGDGIAIPHAKSDVVNEPVLFFLKSKQPIEYDSLDEKPVHLVFMIAVPENSSDIHLKLLSKLSRWLMEENFRESLMNEETYQGLREIILAKENESNISENETGTNGFVIGVTACPTGIAHTYMAAENLEKAAGELGYQVKIETNGSIGVENQLSDEDIKKADAVFIAADTKVNMGRFSGKKLYKTSVSKGIKESQEVIKKAIEAPAFKSDSSNQEENDSQYDKEKKSSVYSSLMNGVSNMLPLVVAGGILIAVSFFWGINSADVNDPSYSKIAAMFKEIGDGAFTLFIPVMAGFIASAIADRPGFAPGLIGGYLANTGGSGFLGAIVAGFLAGYVIKLLRYSFKGLPKSLDGLKPVLLFPLLSVFIVGMATVALLNPFMGEINNWITLFLENVGTANKIILGAVIGIMLAADLGGPINKAAYLFSIGTLASGNYLIMGAALASGMVPSLATAVAATISKRKFTKSQQEASKANYVLGLSFIAEGAIPFAASNPLVILPSLMVGSGVTGALAMILNVSSPAPHGGIFVLPVIGNPIQFLISLIIGVAVATILILLFKRDLTEAEVNQ